MNNSNNTLWLKQIDSKLNTNSTSLTSIDTRTLNNGLTLANIHGELQTIDTSLNNIEADVDELNQSLNLQKRICFNARLTDGSNDYLDRINYTSSPIIFSWSNDLGSTAYITKYKFCYDEANEPSSSELYHSTAWDSKIGAVNSGGTDFEAPFITVKDNQDYYEFGNTNDTKKQWVSPAGWMFPSSFQHAPIEIGISRKFGHYIAGNFSTTDYDSNPVGIIEGFYYSSS